MNSVCALLMWRELNNIQGWNKESDLFQTENKSNTGEKKDENEEVPTSNIRDNIINSNNKKNKEKEHY